MNKRYITVLCGGQSSEHAISIRSASNVLKGLQRDCNEVSLIHIQQDGQWLYFGPQALVGDDLSVCLLTDHGQSVALLPGQAKTPWLLLSDNKKLACDCVVSMLHGTTGEDGAIQGMLRLLNVPFVGADILGSAVCFAKDITKAVLEQAGIQTVPAFVLTPATRHLYDYARVSKRLGSTLVVKPCGQGSSVGVSKVSEAASYQAALAEAFNFDATVLVEQAMDGREIECAVLGNDNPRAAVLGEVDVNAESGLYDYEQKYTAHSQSQVIVPADLSDSLIAEIQKIASEAYQALHCMGMARVDFFVTAADQIYVNEVNTIPGFTDISLYPQCWAHSGLSLEQLLGQLIEHALGYYHAKQQRYHNYMDQRLNYAADIHSS